MVLSLTQKILDFGHKFKFILMGKIFTSNFLNFLIHYHTLGFRKWSGRPGFNPNLKPYQRL